MKLYEYEAKRILRAASIPTPEGEVVNSPLGAREVVLKRRGPVMIKAQVLTTGRGKAGGIVTANDPLEAQKVAERLLGKQVGRMKVAALLVEERLPVEKEYFCGVTYDDRVKSPVALVSRRGGIEINRLATEDKTLVARVPIDPLLGLQPYQARMLAYHLGLAYDVTKRVQEILLQLWGVFQEHDATLVEINPLVLTEDGRIVAADVHMEIEDDALFRQCDRLSRLGVEGRDDRTHAPTDFELAAARIDREDYRGVAGRVIDFGGNLGLLIGAGGGSLTIFDAILRHGGRPANYCEVGGNPPVAKVYELTKLILTKPGVSGMAVITNVFSNSRVDLLARGLVKALIELGIEASEYPLLFRSAGAFEQDGYAVLRKYGISQLDRRTSLDEAARRAVEMMEEAK